MARNILTIFQIYLIIITDIMGFKAAFTNPGILTRGNIYNSKFRPSKVNKLIVIFASYLSKKLASSIRRQTHYLLNYQGTSYKYKYCFTCIFNII